MANLWTGKVKVDNNYVNLGEVSGITFTEGKAYSIQCQDKAYFREGTVGEGFIIDAGEKFILQSKGDLVYVKTFTKETVINIAE